ncbi:MAG: efflux RND transporter periplasmic adaptor subunit [Nitrospiraceae bacterium]
MTTRFNWAKWSVVFFITVIVGAGIWYVVSRGWLAGGNHSRMTEEPNERDQGDMAGMEMPGMEMGDTPKAQSQKASDVPGYAPIMIAPDIQQRIGVTIGSVQRESLRMSVNTVGIVHPNETSTARVHLRANGWVEKLFVNFTGQEVQKGEPLLSIYSPDFLTSQDEYLIASRSKNLQATAQSGQSLSSAALQKLRLLGISDEEIRNLEETGQAKVNLTLRSPITGTVLEKDVLQGDYITPERELYVVSDLSTVWVQAKAYQYELPHVELGMPAHVTVPGLPETRYEGKVVFIQPTVEESTRTVQVRIELPNPDGLLKPDMFVEVEIEHEMGEGLLVPVAALFRTGKRDIVFRAEKENHFMPVKVEISPMKFAKEQYHVLKGLEAGDRIITSANFLIDSESRLRAGAGGMAGMPGMEGMEMGDMEGMDHSKMEGMDDSGMKH